MENIQVALRLRPLNSRELQRQEEIIWRISQKKIVSLSPDHCDDLLALKRVNSNTKTSFCFDYCFNEKDDNIEVYSKTVKRIALSSLNGINGTIFMYGQTGSGKTYTMMGYKKPDLLEENADRSLSPYNSSFNRSTSYSHEKVSEDYMTNDYLNYSRMNNYFITENTGNTGVLILALKDIFKTIEAVTIIS